MTGRLTAAGVSECLAMYAINQETSELRVTAGRRRTPDTAVGNALRQRFALNVRALRQSKGLTQANLAVAAGVGRSFVSQMERGRFSVTLETLGAIAQALDVSPWALLGEF
jgi:DNA-binding XRE family transcriptional regulator